MSKERDNLSLILLNGGIARHYKDWNWQNISSPFSRVYYVIEGTAKVKTGDASHELTPGNLYLIPPFTLHGYQCDGHFSLYYFHIYEKPSTRLRVMEEYNFPFKRKGNELVSMLVARLLEINPGRELHRYDPSLYDNTTTLLGDIRKGASTPYHVSIETNGILSQLFSLFLADATSKFEIVDGRIKKVVSYIRKNIDNPISIEDLSEITFTSGDHLIRIFKNELNCTPMQYINQKKIEKAQLLLATEQISVKNIAYSLAFSNISYFNRIFKRLSGCTPQQYRQNNQNP